jgi:hypothetical protein
MVKALAHHCDGEFAIRARPASPRVGANANEPPAQTSDAGKPKRTAKYSPALII